MQETTREPLADGVYIGLPIEDYIAEYAIGGHGAFKLATSPVDWRWERGDNPLWRAPESKPRDHGRMLHKRLIEGDAAFDLAFATAPPRDKYPDALETSEHFKARLRGLEAAHMQRLGVEKLSREERQPFLLSGKNEELVARIKALDPSAMFWDEIVEQWVGGREQISSDDATYIEIATALARKAYGDLLELGGAALSEVSAFWTVNSRFGPVRLKARWDRITRSRIVDVKKYGLPPKPQHSLRQHLVTQAAMYGYPTQAVMHDAAARFFATDDVEKIDSFVVGGSDDERAIMQDILTSWAKKRPVFWWLFLRCPGPPSGKPIPFRPSDAMWTRAEQTVDDAIFNFCRFRDEYGDALWLDAQDAEEISSEVGVDSDWPSWAFASPLELR